MEKKSISTSKAPKAIGPYSQAIVNNGLVFTSGQIAIVPSTGVLILDIEKATHQVMQNLGEVLKGAQSDFSQVIKSSIFLVDMDDFDMVNKVYEKYFETNVYPARETVAVKTLPKNATVEISMIARVN